ncbi:hypothetical protein NPIL_686221 [Nephila pilipes]|uniref:Uncharacterized protein n=1 Tax=Nephila pilipes TaxID=299642 RepID=A0A8X6QRH3_NEPPI|nr:hypothetical protein NPIL_686221 [Nephila pilipes]
MDWEDSFQAEEPMDWEYVHYLEPENDIMEWEERPPQVCTLFVPKVGEPSQNVSTPLPPNVSKYSEGKVFEPLKTVSPITDPGVRKISKTEVSEQVSTVLETPHANRKEVSSELPEITRRKVRRPPKSSQSATSPLLKQRCPEHHLEVGYLVPQSCHDLLGRNPSGQPEGNLATPLLDYAFMKWVHLLCL